MRPGTRQPRSAAGVSAGTWSATPTPPPPRQRKPDHRAPGPTTIVALNWPLVEPGAVLHLRAEGRHDVDDSVPWVLRVDTTQAPFNGSLPSRRPNPPDPPDDRRHHHDHRAESISGQPDTGRHDLHVRREQPGRRCRCALRYTVDRSSTGYDGRHACAETRSRDTPVLRRLTTSIDWQLVLAAKYGCGSSAYRRRSPKPLSSGRRTGSWHRPSRQRHVYTGSGRDGWTAPGPRSARRSVGDGLRPRL